MKKLFTLLAATLVITAISAQKVEVNGDKVLVDGADYAIIKKTSSGFEIAEYSIQTIDGEEVAVAKLDLSAKTNTGTSSTDYIHVTFMGSGNQASMMYTLTFKKTLAKEIVKCKLFNEGKYNAEGEKKFMILNPYKPMGDMRNNTTTVVVNTGNGGGSSMNYTMVDRNRNASISVFGGKIEQDFEDIGTVKESSDAVAGGIAYTYKFYLLDGTLIAEATIKGIGTKTATIVTLKDHRTHTTTIRSSTFAEEDIAKFLATNYYL